MKNHFHCTSKSLRLTSFLFISIQRAQPDWVEEAGEHPPVFDEKVIKEGILPKINIVAAKPLILEKESVPAIPSGHDTAKKELLSGSEQIKLDKSKKDNEDNDNK